MEIYKKIEMRFFLILLTTFCFHISNVQAQINYWQQTTEFTNKPILSLAFDNEENLYAGTDGDGIYHSTDEGKTWIRFSNGLNDLTVNYIAINKKGYVFVETGSGGGIMATYGGVYRSTDNGINWQFIGSPGTARGLAINSKDQIFAATSWFDTYSSTGGGLLLRSNDDGSTWSDTLLNTFITAMNVDSTGNIFAFTDLGFLRSTNNGVSFVNLNNYSSGMINSIEFGVPNEVFCSTVSPSSVYQSLDNGNSWNNIGNGLKGYIYAIILDKVHNLYAASSGDGLFCLKNNNNIWMTDNQGLVDKNFYMHNWAMDSSGALYCGTTTGKVYRGSFSTSSIEVLNVNNLLKFLLKQNYPNPFNPSTQIKYLIPKSSFVTIKVYDIVGREVATLINEEKPEGIYKVEFNGSNLASGIYFYKIEAGNYSAVKKMILMK